MPAEIPRPVLDPTTADPSDPIAANQTVTLASGPETSATAAGVPEYVGRFLVRSELARGGMGVVYQAFDAGLDREIALKVLGERFVGKADPVRRFIDEARITGQLQHPGIPPVHEVGTLPDGRPFLAMKLIKGRTLEALLKDRPDPSADRGRFVAIFEQLCQAVAYAHSHQVIHRDLKPANIMVGAFGEVQVMDWGLAKALTAKEPEPSTGPSNSATEIRTLRDSDGSETQAGSILGTPAYMPPEQAAGEIALVGTRSDVFGLGAILCVILTGAPPYAGKEPETIRLWAIRAKLDDAFARLDTCGADPELVQLARRCLAPDPVDRPADAGALAAAVHEYRTGVEDRARQSELDRVRTEADGRAAELHRDDERKRWRVQLALAVSLAGFAAVVGIGAWLVQNQISVRTRAEADASRADADRSRAEAERELAAIEQRLERAAAERERDLRRERARTAIAAAITNLPEYYRQALWQTADTLLAQVEQLLGPDDRELRIKLEAAQQQTALVRKLDEISFQKVQLVDGVWDPSTARSKYPVALAAAGFDLVQSDVADLVKRIRTSPVREYILAALDDWIYYEPNSRLFSRILDVSARVTGAAWRTQIPELWYDADGLTKLLATVPPEQITAGLAGRLGLHIDKIGGNGVPLLETALRRYPHDFWLNFELGGRHRENGPRQNMDVAIGYYRTALMLRDVSAAWDDLGKCEIEKKNYDRAVLAFAEAIRADPKNPYPYDDMARTRFEQKDYRGAIDWSEKAIAVHPVSAIYAYQVKAMAHTQLNEPKAALATLRGATAKHPKEAVLWYRLGIAYYTGDQLDDAVTAFDRALTLDLERASPDPTYLRTALQVFRKAATEQPQNARRQYLLGFALRIEARDLAAAATALETAVRLDPTDGAAHHQYGIALQSLGNWSESAKAFRAAIERQPTTAWSHLRLGQSLENLGDTVGALAAYRAAGRHDAASSTGHYWAGTLLSADYQFAAAAEEFEEAVRRQPNVLASRQSLARARLKSGDPTRAIEAYEAALALSPRSELLKLSLANAKLCREADEAWKSGRRPPSPTTAVQGYALADYALSPRDRFADAVGFYRRTFDLDPRYLARGRYNAACAALRWAAGEDPSTPIGLDEWAGLHELAYRWLFADFAATRSAALIGNRAIRSQATRLLDHWEADPDLKSIRDAAALKKLPDVEQKRWTQFWLDVRALRAKLNVEVAPLPRAVR